MLDDVYEWYKKYGKYQNNYSSQGSQSSSQGSKSSQSKQRNEDPERAHKRRRYELLINTLEGYERELQKIINWEKKNPGKKDDNKEIVKNQINVIKDKINLMNNTYKFESVYYYKHLYKLW